MDLQERIKYFVALLSLLFFTYALVPSVNYYVTLLGKWTAMCFISWQVAALLMKFIYSQLPPIKTSDKTIFVSGGDTPLSKEIVRSLVDKKGFKVVVAVSDPDSPKAAAIRNSITNKDRVSFIKMIRSTNEGIMQGMEDLKTKLGSGQQLWGTLIQLTDQVTGGIEQGSFDEQFKKTFETNVEANLKISRESLPMLRKGKGRLVCLSDNFNSIRKASYASHNINSACLEAMIFVFRRELNLFNMPVIMIQPDYVSSLFADPKKKDSHWDRMNVLAAQAVSSALHDRSPEYRYLLSPNLNHGFSWLLTYMVPEELQDITLKLYQTVMGQ